VPSRRAASGVEAGHEIEVGCLHETSFRRRCRRIRNGSLSSFCCAICSFCRAVAWSRRCRWSSQASAFSSGSCNFAMQCLRRPARARSPSRSPRFNHRRKPRGASAGCLGFEIIAQSAESDRGPRTHIRVRASFRSGDTSVRNDRRDVAIPTLIFRALSAPGVPVLRRLVVASGGYVAWSKRSRAPTAT
jgi:hypothetical protein